MGFDVGFLGISALIIAIQWLVEGKRRRVTSIEGELTRAKKFDIPDGLILGTGAVGLSALDLYSATEDHAQFLSVMEHRFNLEMGDADSLDWMAKAISLDSTDSLVSYARNYAGQVGEDSSIAMFHSQGLDAEAFFSRSHADNDLQVTNSDGTITDWSVKSYGNLSDFKSIVAEHPASTHYVVNDEILDQLESSGDLSTYHAQGIEIISGGFSHEAAINEGMDAMNDLADASDVSQGIPVVAAAMFAAKAARNVKAYNDGRQSKREFGVNVASDLGRIGIAGGAAFGGAQVGALIGTAIAPGIGTVIGGFIGSVLGSVGASRAVSAARDEYKWGNIRAATETFGAAFENGLTEAHIAGLQSNIYKIEMTRELLQKERALSRWSRLSLLSFVPLIPKPKTVLSNLYIRQLRRRMKMVPIAAENAANKVYTTFSRQPGNPGESIGDANIRHRRNIGEMILANFDILYSSGNMASADEISPNLQEMRMKYVKEVALYPNHPYRAFPNSSKFLAKICHMELGKLMESRSPEFQARSAALTILIGMLIWLSFA
jgi:hypothetical protein